MTVDRTTHWPLCGASLILRHVHNMTTVYTHLAATYQSQSFFFTSSLKFVMLNSMTYSTYPCYFNSVLERFFMTTLLFGLYFSRPILVFNYISFKFAKIISHCKLYVLIFLIEYIFSYFQFYKFSWIKILIQLYIDLITDVIKRDRNNLWSYNYFRN